MLIEHVDDVIILLFGKQGRLLTISNQSFDLVIEESSVLFDDAMFEELSVCCLASMVSIRR